MDFQQHKYKLVVSICLLHAEKENIKNIINSYNERLENIYNNILEILNQLEKINLIEASTDEKEQIKNLIVYSKIYNNKDDINVLKNNVESNIFKIEETQFFRI